MALLTDRDRDTVRRRLDAITQPVTLLFFTQTIGAPDSALVARQILDELAAISPLVTVEEANLILDKDRAAAFGADRVPTIALLRNGEDSRLRFFGAPAGYEFMSLVDAIVLAGTNDSGLTVENRARLAANVTEPLEVLVFVTPTCPHCPRAVTLAHRMATENALIRATCVEATEFMDLSTMYRVTGVPKTVVVGSGREILGAVPEDQFVAQILGLDEPGSDSAAGPVA